MIRQFWLFFGQFLSPFNRFSRTEGIPQTLEEILDELFKSMLDFPGGAKVNYYFYTAFQRLWKAGVRDDFLTLKNAYPGYGVWVRISLDPRESKNVLERLIKLRKSQNLSENHRT